MKNYLSAALLADFYKLSHRPMYPVGTQYVYSTWTARMSRVRAINKVAAVGFQKFAIEYLIGFFNENFFSRPEEDVIAEYKRVIQYTLNQAEVDVTHIRALHSLGHLPLSIKALPEGTMVPLRVPMMTIVNTHPDFFWVTNYIETLLSCELWQFSTSATLANQYRLFLEEEAVASGGALEFVPFQGHDFSMRGMSSLQSSINSGLGHLLSFTGTDTIPAIQAAEKFYGANIEKELIGTSIPATEHSVQCAYGDDLFYFKNVINRVHKSGFVSIVSDGYDFWGVITEVLPQLKNDIMARDGKVVIRPDSGDPVLIVCGDPEAPEGSPENKGAIECLYELFGGSENAKGFIELDPHIGLIYGDAITFARCEQIITRLMDKGFASTNVVFGVGSFTYQYNTRDTFGFALKSTLCVINGVEKQIFKDPKTDDGTKKSQKGRVAVLKDENGELYLRDCLGLHDEVEGDQLVEIFRDGKLLVEQTFAQMRARIREG